MESISTAAVGPRRRSDDRPAAESVERRPTSGAGEASAAPEKAPTVLVGDPDPVEWADGGDTGTEKDTPTGAVDVGTADTGTDGKAEEPGQEAEADVSAAAADHARGTGADPEGPEEAEEAGEPARTEKSEKGGKVGSTEKPEQAGRAEDASTAGRSGARGGSLVVPMALVAVAAVLAGLGTWFLVQAARYESDGAASNRALVDSVATSELVGQVTSAVEKVFSYNYNDTASTERAAQELLAGAAVEQYNELYAQVKELAPQQRVVLTTRVRTAGVSLLSGDRATVLLFADQQWSRLGEADGDAEQQVQADPVQLAVTVERQDGRWRITEIRPY
ncbi:MAG TPA: hypothetical protein VIL00_09085 [Pseudonocardiaceae bacterium]